MVEAVTATLRRLPLLLALIAFPTAVFAHRLDEYLHATLVEIEPDGLRLRISLTPGVAVAEQVLAVIDHDHDGVISTNEATAYAELLKRDLVVRLDGRDVELRLAASRFPAPTELRTGWGIIQIEFSATPGPLAAGAHSLTLEHRHLSAVSVYLINAAMPKSEDVQITRQSRNDNQSTGEIEFTFRAPANPSRVRGILTALVVLFVAVFVATRLSARGMAPADRVSEDARGQAISRDTARRLALKSASTRTTFVRDGLDIAALLATNL
jgi:hypothetical protein